MVYLPQLEGSRLGRGLLYVIGAYGKKQQLRNGASVLYQGITEAAENTELQQGKFSCRHDPSYALRQLLRSSSGNTTDQCLARSPG